MVRSSLLCESQFWGAHHAGPGIGGSKPRAGRVRPAVQRESACDRSRCPKRKLPRADGLVDLLLSLHRNHSNVNAHFLVTASA